MALRYAVVGSCVISFIATEKCRFSHHGLQATRFVEAVDRHDTRIDSDEAGMKK